MRSSEFLLLFFIFYSSFLTFFFIFEYYFMKKEIQELDKYNEELLFELAKLRRKCYSKNKEE